MSEQKVKAYLDFLRNKAQLTTEAGMTPVAMHPSLFPHQRDIVAWALQRGKALIAASFGMGKSRIQIELLRQIHAQMGRKVMVICPLGVKHQFMYEDGPAMEVRFAYIGTDEAGLNADTPYLITNYERVRDGQISEGFLQSEIAGVCLDEGCFAAGTFVDTPEGQRKIETLRPGDSVYSAAGVDKVVSTTTRVVERLVIVHVDGHAVVSSGNHPYLTVQGWKRADQLKEGDQLVTQDEAVRILQSGIQAQASDESILFQALFSEMDGYSKTKASEEPDLRMVQKRVRSQVERKGEQSFLQPVMLQLMANGAAGNQSALAFTGNSCEAGSQEECLVCRWIRQGAGAEATFCIFAFNAECRDEGKGVCHAEEEGGSTSPAGRKRARPYRSTAEALRGIGRRLDSGVCGLDQSSPGRLADLLLDRYCTCDYEISHRGGWKISLFTEGKRGRQAQDGVFGKPRVERVEILESGDHRLDRYGDAEGRIVLYDIQVEKHPSFSVHGLLVHNSILGNLGTKTQQEFSRILSAIPYRWVATATPAPNDYRQMIYFADFLDAMDAGQSLTRYFGRNPDKAGDLQILPHMERDFWLFVASWCLFIERPSDLGYDDTGYVMPEMKINFHRMTADHLKAQELTDQFGQHFLFADTAAGVQQAMKEKRSSLDNRVLKTAEIVAASPADHFCIWHDLEDERRAICKAVPTAKAVYGSQDSDDAERLVLQFAHGEMPIIAAKPSMFGSGVNWQKYCHRAIYTGVGFKFREFIQSLHRLLRYGQTHEVIVDIIHTDAEDHVVDILMKKWRQHDEMVAKMRSIIKEYGLTNEALSTGMQRSLGIERQVTTGQWFTAINNDTVLETMNMADNSVDEIVTSIPFGNHYEYVASLNDFGHNPADSDFWTQMDFLIPELLRVLKPGRMACIHVKDRLLYGHQTPHGMMEVDYFTHDCARAFKKHGFVSYGEIFVPTDVVRENNSTNRLGWSENAKDGSKMGVGLSEKVLLFRKPQTDKTRSYADEPVRKDKKDYSRGRWQIDAHSLWRSNGHDIDDVAHVTPADDPSLLTGMDGSQVFNWYRDWSKANGYDYHQHVAFNEAMGDRLPAKFMLMPPQAPEEYEEFVWTDVLFMRTLNMNQARRRVEKHLCPLPIDIVERLIVRYSNPGEIILDPFGGLGTTAFVAIQLNRIGYTVELNPEYWRNSVKYCQEMELKRSVPTLFDLQEAA